MKLSEVAKALEQGFIVCNCRGSIKEYYMLIEIAECGKRFLRWFPRTEPTISKTLMLELEGEYHIEVKTEKNT